MVALKQRVQDEVKAQWEEGRKQREHNCSSMTSIGSDNSSVLSSGRIVDRLVKSLHLYIVISRANWINWVSFFLFYPSVNNGDDLPASRHVIENGNAVDQNVSGIFI